MRKRKSTNNFSTILSSFIVLLLVVGVVGFLFVFTENYTTPLKSFHVTCGNDEIIKDVENFDIVVGKEYKFEITTNISVVGSNTKCSVAIVPNDVEETNFTFTSNGTEIKFATMESLTKGFVLLAHDDYFTLTAKMDLTEIMSLYYPNTTILGCPTAIDSGVPYFRLVVTSADQSEIININFNLKSE